MKDIWNASQLAITAIGGWLGWVLGGWDGFLYALVTFVLTDYLTGLMAAAVEKKLSSEIGFKGIFRKVLIFMLVGIGHILDAKVIGDGSVLRTAVIFFYISNEGICDTSLPMLNLTEPSINEFVMSVGSIYMTNRWSPSALQNPYAP